MTLLLILLNEENVTYMDGYHDTHEIILEIGTIANSAYDHDHDRNFVRLMPPILLCLRCHQPYNLSPPSYLLPPVPPRSCHSSNPSPSSNHSPTSSHPIIFPPNPIILSFSHPIHTHSIIFPPYIIPPATCSIILPTPNHSICIPSTTHSILLLPIPHYSLSFFHPPPPPILPVSHPLLILSSLTFLHIYRNFPLFTILLKFQPSLHL
jgi:hypothetical protein